MTQQTLARFAKYGKAARRARFMAEMEQVRKEIISQASTECKNFRSVNGTGGCFVAGTLVHTNRGLVPIEQIRVGDMVLSQPEQTGEFAYKRVLKTFSFEDKQVCLVEYTRLADLTDDDEDKWELLVATIEHPFFVKGSGWTRADNLDPGSKYDLMLRDGSFARCMYQELRNTEVHNVALGMNTHYFDDVGTVVDLRGSSPEITDRDTENDYASGLEGGFCTQRVYNIEVEDYHTYYVGEPGVWVHDSGAPPETIGGP